MYSVSIYPFLPQQLLVVRVPKYHLVLLDSNGFVIDSLEYNDNEPWPVGADAFGDSKKYLSPTKLQYLNYEALQFQGCVLVPPSHLPLCPLCFLPV